jgi:hypothetical protein
MSETVAAASSAAQETPVFNPDNLTTEEFLHWRRTGEAPKPAEPAEAAPQSSEGDKPESDPDSETAQQQETPKQPKKLTAEGRIAQLEQANEEEWQKPNPDHDKIGRNMATIDRIAERAGLKRKTEPAPVTQQQPVQQQFTRPKPTAEDKKSDGTSKYSTYEDFVEDLADWKAEQRFVQVQREQFAQQQMQAMQSQVAEARTRYEDFDSAKNAFTGATLGPQGEPMIPIQVLSMVSESERLTDVIHAIGSDQKALADFVNMARTNPGKAMRYVAALETAIAEELKPKSDMPRDDNGQFASKEPPAKRQTAAPKPATLVSGGASRAFDVNDESLSSDEWARKRNEDLRRRGKA